MASTDDLPDLFSYLDFRLYLKDWFEAKKRINTRFSHRLFARRAGQGSPSMLLAVIEGKRNLTPASTEGFVKALALDAEEAPFFVALVRLECAEDAETRQQAMDQVRATRRFRDARRIDSGTLDYLSRWYYPAIREMAACEGFQDDPSWISSALRPAITEPQAAEALGVLLELGLLARGEDGRLRPTDASVATPHEVAGLAVRRYHLAMIDRSRDSLDYPSGDRHLCALTVAIPEGLIPQLKRELDTFQERLLELCDGAEGKRTIVTQINLHLVPLSVRTENL